MRWQGNSSKAFWVLLFSSCDCCLYLTPFFLFCPGTARKNPGIWKRWGNVNALGLHNLQLSIALKGARLTKVGGFMCYSTCAMNPIENEAVVAEVLRASEGSLELVDRRGEMEGFIARPGLSTWHVMSEPSSRREEKNAMKKNNARMKARRKEWEEKQKQQEDAESGSMEKQEGKGEDKIETADVVPGDLEDGGNPTESKISGNQQENGGTGDGKPLFKPDSFDEAELKKLVLATGLKEFASFDEVPEESRKRVRKSCFPPSPQEAAEFNMERCMRCLPQDMDTGAFFVALFKKVSPINARARERFEKLMNELQDDSRKDSGRIETETEIQKSKKARIEREDDGADINETEQALESNVPPPGKAKRNFMEDKDGARHPTLGKDDFAPISDDLFDPLIEYYGLSGETFRKERFMVRACGGAKALYFLSNSVKTKLIDKGFQERVTVVNSGLKAFVRNNKECEVNFRLSQEAIHFIAPYMTKRKVHASFEDFEQCLVPGTQPLEIFSEAFRSQVSPFSMGSFVVCLHGFEDNYLKKLLVVVWKCRGEAVSVMVHQNEINGMKSKLRALQGGDAESVFQQNGSPVAAVETQS